MIVNLSFIPTKSFVNRQKYALRLRAMENCKSAISRERRLDDDDNDVWSAPMHATVCTFVTRRISRWRIVGARISRRRRQIHDKIERSSIIHISSRISIVIHAGNKHSPFFAKLSEAHAAFHHRSDSSKELHHFPQRFTRGTAERQKEKSLRCSDANASVRGCTTPMRRNVNALKISV